MKSRSGVTEKLAFSIEIINVTLGTSLEEEIVHHYYHHCKERNGRQR